MPPCPRCATVIDDLENLVGELSAVPRCPGGTAALASGRRSSSVGEPLLAGARPTGIGGCCHRGGCHSRGNLAELAPGELEGSPAVVTVVDAKVTRAESLREVDEIRTGVVGLILELDLLQREADLLDARRDADALELRFAPRTALNDF